MHLSSASHLTILLSSVLLLLSFTSGVISPDPKHPTCCKKTETLITDIPLFQFTKCLILPETDKCLKCVMFTGKDGKIYNIDPNAPQLNKRIKRLKKNGVQCKDYTNSTNTNM